MDVGPSAVILFVRRPASNLRSRALVLNSVSGGAAGPSAVILFVRGPASNARSRALVLYPVSGGAAVTRVSGRRKSKFPTDVSFGTVNGSDGFCMGTLTPIPLTSVG